MGNDGGSIPKRHELVKEAARKPTVSELKATALESLSHAWTHCQITDEKLDMEGVVSDCQGRLYNYESILQGLMPSSASDETDNEHKNRATFETTGIRSIRDVVRLQFKRGGSNGKGIVSCPVSMKEIGSKTKSVYLVPCGHAFAEAAIKEIQEEACPECSETFLQRDIIPILPTTEPEILRLNSRMEELRTLGLTHSLKKDKSLSKKKSKKDSTDKVEMNSSAASKTARGAKRKATEDQHRKVDKRISGINNPMAASIASKVLAEQDEQKRRRLAASGR
ncbi:Protein RTF2 -like protein [Ceratocystis lukuohia]|uniref:Protein RTF2 -like protein n=1 Tax=Ceratocystis lukuohia TaxID=2019550 RepID=A0ABR4MP92_9PEZI